MEKFKMDMSPLNEEQMKTMKSLVEYSIEVADRLKQFLTENNLWQKGFRFLIHVNSDLDCYTEAVEFRRTVEDGIGKFNESFEVSRGKGENDNGWNIALNSTSREFIHLLDGEADDSGAEEGTETEKPLPSDGLWVSTDGDPCTMDNWESVTYGEPS